MTKIIVEVGIVLKKLLFWKSNTFF